MAQQTQQQQQNVPPIMRARRSQTTPHDQAPGRSSAAAAPASLPNTADLAPDPPPHPTPDPRALPNGTIRGSASIAPNARREQSPAQVRQSRHLGGESAATSLVQSQQQRRARQVQARGALPVRLPAFTAACVASVAGAPFNLCYISKVMLFEHTSNCGPKRLLLLLRFAA